MKYLILILSTSLSIAADFSFSWNPSTHPDVVGYQFRAAPAYFSNSTGINGYWAAPKYTRALSVSETNIVVELHYTNFFAVINQVLSDGTVIPYSDPLLVRVPSNPAGVKLVE